MVDKYIRKQDAINVAQNYHCSHDITIIPNTDYSMGFYDGLAIRENDILQGLSELKLVADVRENVHGEWEDKIIKSNYEIGQWQSARCNKCGLLHITPHLYYFDNFNFCPNCGAKMDAQG